MAINPAHRQALIDSLRQRWAEAERLNDSRTKQALFKEATYLGIQPVEISGEV